MLSPAAALSGMAAASTSFRRGAGIIQNLKNVLRARPGFNIDLFLANLARRLLQLFELASAAAEFAIAVRGDFFLQNRRAQVRHVAKKFHRRFAIAVLHFPVGRTHPAESLNAAIDALGDASPLARAHLLQRTFPRRFDAEAAD